ncbi:MAG: SRPBCC domain-containing protein [Proteobacteria bacterium]|nr:SRPBCC domain-containing protein [Pseudomonadota bacterium]
MSTVISAARERVWRALTDPEERVCWDARLLASIDAPADYPFAGQHVRWRYRMGGIQMVLHDRPQTVVPPERLQSALAVGTLHMDQTLTLVAEKGNGKGASPRTRLSMSVIAANSVPILGSVIDRFSVRELATDYIDETLRALEKWCAGHD